MKEIIADYDYAEVTYHPDLLMGKVVWKRKTTDQEYRNAFTKLLEFSMNHTVDNFLSDIRNQGVVSPENRKWFETEMLPKAVKSGLKRAATVFDGNVFKKYYMNMIIKVSNKFGMPLKLVKSEQEAIEWFNSFN